jgi:hypothetical protein
MGLKKRISIVFPHIHTPYEYYDSLIKNKYVNNILWKPTLPSLLNLLSILSKEQNYGDGTTYGNLS